MYRELLQATCTYPTHLRRDSETIVAQVSSVSEGRQPGQRESYECIRRTHHGILGQKEKIRLAGSRETRLRGNKQREGAFSRSCWICVLWGGGKVGIESADQHRHQAEMGLCMRMCKN